MKQATGTHFAGFPDRARPCVDKKRRRARVPVPRLPSPSPRSSEEGVSPLGGLVRGVRDTLLPTVPGPGPLDPPPTRPQLALQMVGNMKCPISRKNRPRSWREILELIVRLRREVGIVDKGRHRERHRGAGRGGQ